MRLHIGLSRCIIVKPLTIVEPQCSVVRCGWSAEFRSSNANRRLNMKGLGRNRELRVEKARSSAKKL